MIRLLFMIAALTRFYYIFIFNKHFIFCLSILNIYIQNALNYQPWPEEPVGLKYN